MNNALQPLLDVLQQGGVVASPTETVVGLLADALNPQAVARVKNVKGPGRTGAISVLLPSLEALAMVAEPLESDALSLAQAHWPGPLTIVTKAREGLSPLLLQNGTIAVRVPGPSPAADLVQAFGGPLTATSANRSGVAPVCRAAELPSDLAHELDGLQSGRSPGGLPSTIVDVTQTPFVVLRAGALSLKR